MRRKTKGGLRGGKGGEDGWRQTNSKRPMAASKQRKSKQKQLQSSAERGSEEGGQEKPENRARQRKRENEGDRSKSEGRRDSQPHRGGGSSASSGAKIHQRLE